SRLSWPICARSSRCASASVRPIGPLTLNGVRLAGLSTLGTTPGDGRKPATPQNDAGVLRLPPRSEPGASGTCPSASATAAPPDEPPQVLTGLNGLPVAP